MNPVRTMPSGTILVEIKLGVRPDHTYAVKKGELCFFCKYDIGRKGGYPLANGNQIDSRIFGYVCEKCRLSLTKLLQEKAMKLLGTRPVDITDLSNWEEEE